MSGERSISERLVDEITGVIRARQASLAYRIGSYGEASWAHEPGERPEHPITHQQISELVELVIEAFEDVRGEIQGVVEIDAALFTRGLDALRQADLEDDAA
jgi:hypothetical protein